MQISKEENLKAFLRKEALNKRGTMAKTGLIKKISKAITENILKSNDYKNAKNIALYYPVKNEIDITGILCSEKNFFFPKCIDCDMFFCKANSIDLFEAGCFNIPEPKGNPIDPKILDIMYIPALMANNKKYRLGYGKGFYDKFFKNNEIKAKKVIVIASDFINDKFIEDEFDYKCDEIMTEIC